MTTKLKELATHNQIISNEIINQLSILKDKLTIKFDSYEVVPILEIVPDFNKDIFNHNYRIRLDSFYIHYKGALIGSEYSKVLESVEDAKQFVNERFDTNMKLVDYQRSLRCYEEEVEEYVDIKNQALESLIVETTFCMGKDTYEPQYNDDLTIKGYKVNGGEFYNYGEVIETHEDLKKFINFIKK